MLTKNKQEVISLFSSSMVRFLLISDYLHPNGSLEVFEMLASSSPSSISLCFSFWCNLVEKEFSTSVDDSANCLGPVPRACNLDISFLLGLHMQAFSIRKMFTRTISDVMHLDNPNFFKLKNFAIFL